MRKIFNIPHFTDNELIYGDTYDGYPLMRDKGPFVRKHLDKIIDVMNASLHVHPRTFAFRADLRLPRGLQYFNENRLIERFISSFKAKVLHARATAKRTNPKAHDTSVRYVCAREVGQRGVPHYHLVIFVNRDAFNCLGRYELGRSNLYTRLVEAWASALRIRSDAAIGLVEIPKNAKYQVTADDFDSQDELFYRASYMAKSATKVKGSRHCFGGSRL